MNKGYRKVLLFATLLGSMSTLTSCTSAEQEAKQNFDDTMVMALNSSDVVKEKLGSAEVADYEILAASAKQNADSSYIVKLNGVMSDANQKLAYVDTAYKVGSADLGNANNNVDFLKNMEKLIVNYDLRSFNYVPVSNLANTNNSIVKNVDCPFDGFSLYDGICYGVSNPQINEEKGYASFRTDSYVKFKKSVTQTSYGIKGMDAKGNPVYGLVTKTTTSYQDTYSSNDIYVKATEDEIADFKTDFSKAINKFVEAEKTNDKSSYTINNVSAINDADIQHVYNETGNFNLK